MKEKRQFLKTYITAIIVCLCFLAFSVCFVFYMMCQNEQENTQYLFDVAKQNQITLTKQMIGDFQTLNGIAVCIGDADISDPDTIVNILTKINNNNTFVRMGLANLDGTIDLLDINGNTYEDIDISSREFFHQAVQGENVISETFKDPFGDGYINYYAVPVYHNGDLVSVLCAVNSSDIFRDIIDAPVLNGKGYSNIINSQGKIVIRSSHTNAVEQGATCLDDMGTIGLSERRRVFEMLNSGQSGSFAYSLKGQEQLGAVQSVGINDWYVLSVVSQEVLKDRFKQMALGTSVIIVGACIIFLFLLYRQSRIMAKNRNTLMHLAYDDPLTGYRNFEKFLLDAEPLLRQRNAKRYAVWYCDLKKFKYYNDIFGYHRGDLLLKHIAGLFGQTAKGDALFCRVSADNFVGIRQYTERKELEPWFNYLISHISREDFDATTRLHIELCMGFYCVDEPEENASLNDMVNWANMAQKSVKHLTGSHFAFFTQASRSQILRESKLEATANNALETGRFVMYLQPKVDIQNGNRIAGAEVLTRWDSPEQGIISPGEFIPLFEKSGFIVKLDRYIFEQACKWLKNYLDAGKCINLAVNVSRLGLLQEDFVEYYSEIKRKYEIPDHVLELEFTETIFLDGHEIFKETVNRLHENGFTCSLDDFGAGYSSLNMLKNLPIDVLKLDILFFKSGIDINRERIVISHVVSMAKELRINTIAEGVETMDQVYFLKKVGCDIVQGYVFSKPLPLMNFERLIGNLPNRPLTLKDYQGG